jgi:hypothetical protein
MDGNTSLNPEPGGQGWQPDQPIATDETIDDEDCELPLDLADLEPPNGFDSSAPPSRLSSQDITAPDGTGAHSSTSTMHFLMSTSSAHTHSSFGISNDSHVHHASSYGTTAASSTRLAEPHASEILSMDGMLFDQPFSTARISSDLAAYMQPGDANQTVYTSARSPHYGIPFSADSFHSQLQDSAAHMHEDSLLSSQRLTASSLAHCSNTEQSDSALGDMAAETSGRTSASSAPPSPGRGRGITNAERFRFMINGMRTAGVLESRTPAWSFPSTRGEQTQKHFARANKQYLLRMLTKYKDVIESDGEYPDPLAEFARGVDRHLITALKALLDEVDFEEMGALLGKLNKRKRRRQSSNSKKQERRKKKGDG